MVFDSDAWYLTFIVLLAVSNGYVGNIATMFAPKVVSVRLHHFGLCLPHQIILNFFSARR